MVANMEGKRRSRESVNHSNRSRGLKAAITGLCLCASKLPQTDSSDSDSSDSDSNDFDLAARALATTSDFIDSDSSDSDSNDFDLAARALATTLDLNDSDSDDECVIM